MQLVERANHFVEDVSAESFIKFHFRFQSIVEEVDQLNSLNILHN